MIKNDIAIHWFRNDLRIHNNNSLLNLSQKYKIFPIFIFDEIQPREDSANYWWLIHSLDKLNQNLNGNLHVYHGKAADIIRKLIQKYNIKALGWNRCYDPSSIERDRFIKEEFKNFSLDYIRSENSHLLWEPWKVKPTKNKLYTVFTPFYKKGCVIDPINKAKLNQPLQVVYSDIHEPESLFNISHFNLPIWTQKFNKYWKVGEESALRTFSDFVEKKIDQYKDRRNDVDSEFVSQLSPYIHFGEISIHQMWDNLIKLPCNNGINHFKSELGWREFSYYLLFNFPDIKEQNIRPEFNSYPWKFNETFFEAWKWGKTGYPMVDAAMRSLYETGYLHNRCRMIVASFLTKNLNIHWKQGAEWFDLTLMDADLASNYASWQWAAGSGTDTMQYSRIFHPVIQGKKFDVNGSYVRQHLPEISRLPNEYIHCPWEAPQSILQNLGIQLGKDYPNPIVNFEQSTLEANKRFEIIQQLIKQNRS